MNTKLITLTEASDLDIELQDAAEVIRAGGLVVFPTETVYGLGADGTNATAAAKIYAAKGRPSDNPLIIHIEKPEDAEKYAYTCDTYYKLAAEFMPGPLTVVLDAKDTVPPKTRGGLSTVAVRCPSNKIANTLIRLSGVPIAAPSANISGKPSPTSVQHVIDDMLGRVDIIIDGGEADFGLESTIVKIDKEGNLTMLRPGKITVDNFKNAGLNCGIADAVVAPLKDGEIALSPGMKYRHYAPKSPVLLCDGELHKIISYIKAENKDNIAIISYSDDIAAYKAAFPSAEIYDFALKDDELSQAHNLFSILREADKKDFTVIYAPMPKTDGIGLALYNRMIRAAAYRIIKL